MADMCLAWEISGIDEIERVVSECRFLKVIAGILAERRCRRDGGPSSVAYTAAAGMTAATMVTPLNVVRPPYRLRRQLPPLSSRRSI